jgi:hypothetical protein
MFQLPSLFHDKAIKHTLHSTYAPKSSQKVPHRSSASDNSCYLAFVQILFQHKGKFSALISDVVQDQRKGLENYSFKLHFSSSPFFLFASYKISSFIKLLQSKSQIVNCCLKHKLLLSIDERDGNFILKTVQREFCRKDKQTVFSANKASEWVKIVLSCP